MSDPGRKSSASSNAPMSSHRREYERRVNRVVDYVQAHLADELTLERLAAVAAFSPFHFHRVFVGITGETLSDFIRRARDLRQPGTLTIGIGHDAPRIADPDKLRYDACIVVREDFRPDRFVNVADLPGGKYAVARFEGAPTGISEAWDTLFTTWIPSSGYQPEDRPCLELYRGDGARPAPGHLRCELCLPVGPL